MKIYVDQVKLPAAGANTNIENPKFVVSVYGDPDYVVSMWIAAHGFETAKSGPYTNINVTKPVNDVFISSDPFDYLDGFSPNLNKHLHIGHASNLILAKAFQRLGVAKDTIAILGDTLEGEVSKDEALASFFAICEKYEYHVSHRVFYASEMKLEEAGYDMPTFVDGEGKYAGTKVFDIDGEKIVGVKSDGSTSYFYQDVALAQQLGLLSSVLYMTGSEQNQHFANLKKLFHKSHHIGLGLVKANGEKMASRKGNTIMFDDVTSMLSEQFSDYKLAYNVLAGFILRSAPKSDKNINLDFLANPLNSPGLYLSYTLAKLKSAGANLYDSSSLDFDDQALQFKELRAKRMLQPNVLFDGLVEHAHMISKMYESNRIQGNEENIKLFSGFAADLSRGMHKLGMFDVERV